MFSIQVPSSRLLSHSPGASSGRMTHSGRGGGPVSLALHLVLLPGHGHTFGLVGGKLEKIQVPGPHPAQVNQNLSRAWYFFF